YLLLRARPFPDTTLFRSGYPGEHGPAGAAWRQRVGLPRGGPAALITTLAVFTFDRENGEAMLQSYHPGTTIEQVQEQTGWPLRRSEEHTSELQSPDQLVC